LVDLAPPISRKPPQRRPPNSSTALEFENLDALLHAWHACYGTKPATLHQAVQDIGWYAPQGKGELGNKWNDLRDALGAFDERHDGKSLNKRAIAKSLPRIAGRVIDGKRLISLGKDRTNKTLWEVSLLQTA
jgi:hypothetical protein